MLKKKKFGKKKVHTSEVKRRVYFGGVIKERKQKNKTLTAECSLYPQVDCYISFPLSHSLAFS